MFTRAAGSHPWSERTDKCGFKNKTENLEENKDYRKDWTTMFALAANIIGSGVSLIFVDVLPNNKSNLTRCFVRKDAPFGGKKHKMVPVEKRSEVIITLSAGKPDFNQWIKPIMPDNFP